MATGLLAQRVDGIKPVAPPVSILTAARPLPANVEWKSGVTWRASAKGDAYRRVYCGDAESTYKNDADTFNTPTFFPYTIYVPYECDWITPGAAADEFSAESRAELDAMTAWNVSREIWTAATDTQNPSLMSEATDVSAAAAVHPVEALATLLSNYGDCSMMGGAIVHVPALVIPSLFGYGQIRQVGDVYYGPLGSVISPGPGYPGSGAFGPDAAASGATNVWMYVSGPVEYGLGPISLVPEDEARWFDHRRNRYSVWAEREVLHRFDTECIFAVKTYIPAPSSTEAV